MDSPYKGPAMRKAFAWNNNIMWREFNIVHFVVYYYMICITGLYRQHAGKVNSAKKQ